MTRTRPTPTTRLTPNWGTSSGTNPGEDFEEPQDISDVAQLETEIPRGNRGGGRGIDFPSNTGGLGDQIPSGSRRPTGGIDLLKDPPGGFGAPRKSPGGGMLPGKATPRSPIGVEIGKSVGGGLGVGVSIPLGGPISARGGINIGAGGAIKGAQVGLGVGIGPIGASIDVGTDQNEAGEGGCYQFVTVTAGPFSHTYGRNVCEPKPPNEAPIIPIPTPQVTEPIGNAPDNPLPPTFIPNFDPKCKYWVKLTRTFLYFWQNIGGFPVLTAQNRVVSSPDSDAANAVFVDPVSLFTTTAYIQYFFADGRGNFTRIHDKTSPNINHIDCQNTNYGNFSINSIARRFQVYGRSQTGTNSTGQRIFGKWQLMQDHVYDLKEICIKPPPPLSPPAPNPPPTKKMNDTCCKKSLILQAEILRLLGRELGPEGLVPQTKKAGFIGEEFERVQTPIENPSNPKKIKVRFTTLYELLMYALKQANSLDTALDPQSYKIPTGKLQNPAYNRDSEHSLKSNSQPNRDKAGNKRELEINKDDEAKMSGFLQQSTYMFQMLRRFEYLFPPGELEDALMAKSLLIPGAKGDIKIHNMIMAYELQMQYLDAALGNPREQLVIKDANPAIEGDQPIEVTSLSISDLLRQNIKFHIDTGGDVDALVNLVLRDFRTNLANRIDLIKNTEMVQALFEDSGMLEKQEYIDIHLEGDVYAGQWIKGQGFKANPNLEKKTEEATEEVLRATMKPVDQKIKVSRRSKEEKTDMRDLLRGLADFIQRLVSIPSAGDAGKAIDKLVESAKFKVQTDMALLRQNVTQAAAASRNRTKKRKK